MPDNEEFRAQLASVKTELAAVKDDVHAMKADIREVRDVIMIGNGVWKVAAIIGGVFLIVLGGVLSSAVSMIWTR